MRTIEIGKNDAGQRLDKFLTKRFKTMPKALMYKYIRTKYIKLNGKRCEISSRLNEGDILTLYIKDEFFEPQKAEYDFMKAPLKLDVVYEDENILLIDKKPGLIVHPDENYHFDSALEEYSIIFMKRENTIQNWKIPLLLHLSTELTATQAV